MNAYANAPAFKPVYSDQHSLYLTFSNGFPLTESQIFKFFNRRFAPYVEKVFIYRPRGGRGPPLFGKVVFKHTLTPDLVMGNNQKVYFDVDGRPLYCRRCVSQKSITAATASNSLRDGGSHHGGMSDLGVYELGDR